VHPEHLGHLRRHQKKIRRMILGHILAKRIYCIPLPP